MLKQILKRVEALERAADKELFAIDTMFPYAIAYYLGKAKHPSEAMDAYARTLGYQDFERMNQGFMEMRHRPFATLDSPFGPRARTWRARSKLITNFGFKLDGARPAALQDALYQIVGTLPEEWRAAIISGDRKWCETIAAADRIFQIPRVESRSMLAGGGDGDSNAQKGAQETLEQSSSTCRS
jgi:hypothetical protein